MKIDAETLKKQVILHLPYVLFLLVFAKLGEAVRLAPGADASQKLLGLSEGFALAFQSMWPGAIRWTRACWTACGTTRCLTTPPTWAD